MAEVRNEHGPEVPVADAVEQDLAVEAASVAPPAPPEATTEADTADVWEQQQEVPAGDDDEHPLS